MSEMRDFGWVRYQEGSGGFRAGQWAQVVWFRPSDDRMHRGCLVARFPDGVEDAWPLVDWRSLEFTEEDPFPESLTVGCVTLARVNETLRVTVSQWDGERGFVFDRQAVRRLLEGR